MARGSAFGEHDVPASPCPRCGHILDLATGERDPRPGDYAGCAYCGGINRFDNDLRLRAATQAEIAEIRRNPQTAPGLLAFAQARILGPFWQLAAGLHQGRSARPSITCPRCGFTSRNPEDVRNRYCGHCRTHIGRGTENPRA